ncbi:MAG: DUF3048 domain-containing protein, partial [bacterium]|nr:DUF3048 domain-containing protein [bacterium]
MTNKKLSIVIFSSALTIAVSAIGAYTLTNYFNNPSVSMESPVPSLPNASLKPVGGMSYCPLNGKKYDTKSQIEWEQKLPVAVMIENHPESRPQSGLNSADVVYEAVAEGGITRFMALFLCEPSPQIVGPVRSARTYFLDWLQEYNPLYAHVGGANTPGRADALGQIRQYGIKDLDQMGAGLEGGYYRDENRIPSVALEHTMYLNIDKLREYGSKKFKWGVESPTGRWESTFERLKFKEVNEGGTQKDEAPL